MMMKKKLLAVLLAAALCLLPAAMAENNRSEEPVFPDFSVTDTDGNVFTLSEKLQEYDAVLINIWATWCPPCRAEFPYLNEAFRQYGDRVAFIALSCETTDTMRKISDFRKAYHVEFPMGQDPDQFLAYLLRVTSIPTTAIVDRSGHLVFLQYYAFSGQEAVTEVLERVLAAETETDSGEMTE